MLRPVCVRCNREMTCTENGAMVRTCPGVAVSGDMYSCPSCGAQVVVGFAHQPVQWSDGARVVADLSGSVTK